MAALLELEGLSKSYGALKVIDDLDVHLDEGEALGVVGPNGAGKTTMLHLAAGQLRPDAGRVRLDGRDVTGLPARARCQLGLARTYQVPQPFTGMTVYENVLVGATFGGDREAHLAALEALELAELTAKANRLAGSLTLLERKRLELARALATGPRVLLLDEVASPSPRSTSWWPPSARSARPGCRSCGSNTSSTPCCRWPTGSWPSTSAAS